MKVKWESNYQVSDVEVVPSCPCPPQPVPLEQQVPPPPNSTPFPVRVGSQYHACCAEREAQTPNEVTACCYASLAAPPSQVCVLNEYSDSIESTGSSLSIHEIILFTGYIF